MRKDRSPVSVPGDHPISCEAIFLANSDILEPKRCIPRDARLTQLHDHEKLPTSVHGHHANEPAAEFFALGQNVGIVLDEQFLVIDIDRPDADAARFLAKRLEEHPTWRQRTRKGRHWLFRVPPEFCRSVGNSPLYGAESEKPYGDMKTLGYIVAPGSEVDGFTYEIEAGLDPQSAPPWLLDFARNAKRAFRAQGEAQAGRRDQIPVGEHDNALASILGQVARSSAARLSQGALERVAAALVREAGILAPSDGRPYGPGDFRRLAESALRFGDGHPAFDPVSIMAPGLVSGAEVSAVGPTQEWWVHGFFPHGELVTLFGKGGIGKSTTGSWLAAQVTRKPGNFAWAGVEEPFHRFLGRAILAGADRSRIFALPNPSKIQLPRDIPQIIETCRGAEIKVLYFDSIMSHFSREETENAAERARRVLGPLAEAANREGIMIVGIFHENKLGEFKGATEMIDVARHSIKAYRKRNGPLHLKVWKSNMHTPRYALTLVGKEVEYRIGDEVQYEEARDGSVGVAKIIVPELGEDLLDEPEIDPRLDDGDVVIPEGEQIKTKRSKAKVF